MMRLKASKLSIKRLCIAAVTASFFLCVAHGATAEIIGEIKTVRTSYTDTLIALARTNNLGFTEIVSANPDVDPWLPGENKDITLPTQFLIPERVENGFVINLAEMRLYYFPQGKDQTVQTFPIGIGREGFETPVGETKISWKRQDPPWTPTPDMRKANPDLPDQVPPGPENPLGSHAVYLELPNYLLHGTSKPWGIGQRVSSGCLRLYPEDIKKVYALAERGMPVKIIDRPVKLGWYENAFYMEVHPFKEEIDSIDDAGDVRFLNAPKGTMTRIQTALAPFDKKINWRRVEQALEEKKGYPVQIFEKPEEDSTEDDD